VPFSRVLLPKLYLENYINSISRSLNDLDSPWCLVLQNQLRARIHSANLAIQCYRHIIRMVDPRNKTAYCAVSWL
jgi:hypothetical protein